MKRCLRRLGFTFRRACRVPPKAPPEQQQARMRRALSRLHRLEAAGRCQVLGLMSRAGQLHSFPTQEKLTAQHLIQSVESLLPLSLPTTLVLDNASVHRAKAVRQKQGEWRQKGLRVLFLPPYCPPMNKIEVLWRQVKYRRLAPEAYADFQTLCQSVTDVLADVGTKHQLSFA